MLNGHFAAIGIAPARSFLSAETCAPPPASSPPHQSTPARRQSEAPLHAAARSPVYSPACVSSERTQSSPTRSCSSSTSCEPTPASSCRELDSSETPPSPCVVPRASLADLSRPHPSRRPLPVREAYSSAGRTSNRTILTHASPNPQSQPQTPVLTCPQL